MENEILAYNGYAVLHPEVLKKKLNPWILQMQLQLHLLMHKELNSEYFHASYVFSTWNYLG